MERVVIVGGGIAGLSCLNALLDKGISALLLEGGTIGSPKICGEFLAPLAVSLLDQWEIGPIQTIKEVNFFAKNKHFKLDFPKMAGAFSRSDAELLLAKRAKEKGGRIQENALIQKILPAEKNSFYTFYLSSGEVIQADTAIFATGKWDQKKMTTFLPYFALKTHFPFVVKPETLLMYSLPGVYFGIVPVSDHSSNFACLVKREVFSKSESSKQFFYHLVQNNKSLQQIVEHIDIEKINLLEGATPEFLLKKNPNWPKSFWIGDALASIPPAIGYGFAHSIRSGMLAADYYFQNNPIKYRKISTKILKPKLSVGQLMHRLLLNPLLGFLILPLLKMNPWALNIFLKKLELNRN